MPSSHAASPCVAICLRAGVSVAPASSTYLDGIAMSTGRKFDAHSNQLIGAMESASPKRIESNRASQPGSTLSGGQACGIVCDAGDLLKHAYFSQGTVVSLLTVLAAIETAT